MATEPVPAMVHSPPEEERAQEAALNASIAQLQGMHIALRRLRDTIPRVVTSLQTADSIPDPAELYSQFSHAATTAGKDIKEFMQMMGDERAKEVFEQVSKSRKADGEGIEVWKITEHDDWLDVKKELREETDGIEESEGLVGAGEPEKRGKVIEAFRAAHPDIEILSGDVITIKLSTPVNLYFVVARKQETSQQNGTNGDTRDWGSALNWKISTITSSSTKETKLTKGIFDALNANQRHPIDLGSLLEMVASYSDVTTRPCAKCSRLIDRTGQLPIIRTRKRTKQADGQYATQWLAFHRACT